MSEGLEQLLANNRAWSAAMHARDPAYFRHLANQQAPEYLWIGCSDSRVPANQITGLNPGEVFVHRNVGNVVVQTDLNCLSVLQFAVDLLKVRHIIVVGHYGCSGVRTVMENRRVGLADNWLRQIENVSLRHAEMLTGSEGESRLDLLCELNVIEQVINVCRTTVVQDAWQRQQHVTIHGWIYGLKDGLLRDMGMSISPSDNYFEIYRQALASLSKRI